MKKDEKQDKKNKSGEDKISEKISENNKEKYKPMTTQEIKQLAEDMYKELVFTDRNIRIKEDVPRVFMVLALMGKELIDELQKNPPGMIYEYMDRAGPLAINGMPMFTSFKIVGIEDTKKVFEQYNKIVEAVANA